MTKRDIPPLVLLVLALLAGTTFIILSRLANVATADLGKSLEPTKPANATTITPASLDAALRSGDKPLVIDTRDEESYNKGHIGTSLLLDHTTFTQQRGKFLLAGTDTPIVLICARDTACEEANLLYASFIDLAFTNVTYLLGGYDAWKSESFPESTSTVDPNSFIDIVGEQLTDIPSLSFSEAMKNDQALWIVITPFENPTIQEQLPRSTISIALSSLYQEMQKDPLKNASSVFVISSSVNQAKIAAMKIYSDLQIPSSVVTFP